MNEMNIHSWDKNQRKPYPHLLAHLPHAPSPVWGTSSFCATRLLYASTEDCEFAKGCIIIIYASAPSSKRSWCSSCSDYGADSLSSAATAPTLVEASGIQVVIIERVHSNSGPLHHWLLALLIAHCIWSISRNMCKIAAIFFHDGLELAHLYNIMQIRAAVIA